MATVHRKIHGSWQHFGDRLYHVHCGTLKHWWLQALGLGKAIFAHAFHCALPVNDGWGSAVESCIWLHLCGWSSQAKPVARKVLSA